MAERIAKGPIPVDEALRLFKQIAEGLEAAHEKGVIHRHLKPANIKATPEWKVKVLDFGLAKALVGEARPQDLSQSPTMPREGTELGVLLGTAPYMSPEQARGKEVDKRTDIWAFGCCLYEALTGKVAFLGETVSDTLAKVLEREPDWEALPASTRARFRSLLGRCLQKDATKRLHDIADARIELEETLDAPSIDAAGAAAIVRPASWRRAVQLALGTSLVVGVLTDVAVWSVMRPSPAEPKLFVIDLPDTRTTTCHPTAGAS